MIPIEYQQPNVHESSEGSQSPSELAKVYQEDQHSTNQIIARRQRDFPITAPWTTVLMKVLLWPSYYRVYAYTHISAQRVQEHFLSRKNVRWVPRDTLTECLGSYDRPRVVLIYFYGSKVAILYQRDLRQDERARKRKYVYR